MRAASDSTCCTHFKTAASLPMLITSSADKSSTSEAVARPAFCRLYQCPVPSGTGGGDGGAGGGVAGT